MDNKNILLQQQNVQFCQQNVWLLRQNFWLQQQKNSFVVPNFVAVTKPFFSVGDFFYQCLHDFKDTYEPSRTQWRMIRDPHKSPKTALATVEVFQTSFR